MFINFHLHLNYICLTHNGQISRAQINFQKAQTTMKVVILVFVNT